MMTSFLITDDAASTFTLHRSSSSFVANDDCVDATVSWNSAMTAVDQIRAMKRQEETCYKSPNYFGSAASTPQQTMLRRQSSTVSTSSTSSFLSMMQEIPVHLQQAAFEECAQFIDSLSVSPPSTANNALPLSRSSSSFGDLSAGSTRSPMDSGSDDHFRHEKSSSFNLSFFFPWTQKHQGLKSPACVVHPGITSATESGGSCFSSLDASPTAASLSNKDAIATWRRQMCTWSYQVVDAYAFSRDTVSVAFSILDRYLAALLDSPPPTTSCHRATALDRSEFQLLSMTSLMIAIKVMQPSYAKLSLEALLDMSRRVYTPTDFKKTEMDILLLLNWRVHPPTPVSFVRLFLDVAANGSNNNNNSLKCMSGCYEEVMEEATHWTEMAVGDATLVSCKPSNIALASIFMACHCYDDYYFEEEKEQRESFGQNDDGCAAFPQSSSIANEFAVEMQEAMNIHVWSRDVELLFRRLDAIRCHQQRM